MKNHTGERNLVTKPKQEPDDKEQSERFKETAKELGIDEDDDAFDRALKTIVTPKSPEPPPQQPK